MKLLKMLGLHKIFLKKFNISQDDLKKELQNEYDAYLKLKSWFRGKQMTGRKITMYYPGCGSDILTPLAICDAIISSKTKVIDIFFQDTRDLFDGILYNFQKFTNPVIIINDTKERYSATIYYTDKTINVYFYVSNFNNIFPKELKDIDIYYERAFEMFRSYEFITMSKIYKNIKPLGLMITDHSFKLGNYSDKFKKLKGIPPKFGLYKRFQIWQKVKDK